MATDKIKVAVRVRPFNRRGLYTLYFFIINSYSSILPDKNKQIVRYSVNF